MPSTWQRAVALSSRLLQLLEADDEAKLVVVANGVTINIVGASEATAETCMGMLSKSIGWIRRNPQYQVDNNQLYVKSPKCNFYLEDGSKIG
jgi:hypothetical protein